MAKNTLPSQAELHALLIYEPDSGKLTWRARPQPMFPNFQKFLAWNTRCAGEETFTIKHSSGYMHGSILGRKYLAHRVIWKMVHGVDPRDIDHLDGNKHNNRLDNLRECSRSENNRNRRRGSNNTSGCTGVHWDKQMQRWYARIEVAGEITFLGYCKSKEEAIARRKAVEPQLGFLPGHDRD